VGYLRFGYQFGNKSGGGRDIGGGGRGRYDRPGRGERKLVLYPKVEGFQAVREMWERPIKGARACQWGWLISTAMKNKGKRGTKGRDRKIQGGGGGPSKDGNVLLYAVLTIKGKRHTTWS